MGECQRVESIVRTWEEGDVVSLPDHRIAVGHCAACRRCASRFAALVSLMARDSVRAAEPRKPIWSSRMTDRVMARVRSTAPRPILPRLSWPALAAAAAVFAVGIATAVVATRASETSNSVMVSFEVAVPGVKSVAVVGTFTDWDPSRLPMRDADGDGVWQITVQLEKDSVAIYNFVIDGSRWIPDPSSTAQIEDDFGGLSSVLRL